TVSAWPRWLTDSFTQTGESIQVSNGRMMVWKKDVPAGPITLPGNQYQAPPSLNAQYFVLLEFHGPAPYLVWDVSPPEAPSPAPQSWVWDQAASNTTPIFFLKAGSHTLTIRQRESGTKLDKLVITNNVNLVPQP